MYDDSSSDRQTMYNDSSSDHESKYKDDGPLTVYLETGISLSINECSKVTTYMPTLKISQQLPM